METVTEKVGTNHCDIVHENGIGPKPTMLFYNFLIYSHTFPYSHFNAKHHGTY